MILCAACASGGGGWRLTPGTAVTGRLDPAAPQFRDGSRYRRYDLVAQAGDTLRVTLTSDDFDANLILTDPWGNPVSRNDDGGERCNARLTYVAKVTGPHRILVNSSWPDEVGEYRLAFSRSGREPAVADSTCDDFGKVEGLIRIGESVSRGLADGDPMFDSDSTFFHQWILPVAAGDTLTIDMESEVFDAYLLLTRGRGDRLATDDDGGGSCHARIVYVATDPHPVRILANTALPHATGRYTLRVRAGASPVQPGSAACNSPTR